MFAKRRLWKIKRAPDDKMNYAIMHAKRSKINIIKIYKNAAFTNYLNNLTALKILNTPYRKFATKLANQTWARTGNVSNM